MTGLGNGTNAMARSSGYAKVVEDMLPRCCWHIIGSQKTAIKARARALPVDRHLIGKVVFALLTGKQAPASLTSSATNGLLALRNDRLEDDSSCWTRHPGTRRCMLPPNSIVSDAVFLFIVRRMWYYMSTAIRKAVSSSKLGSLVLGPKLLPHYKGVRRMLNPPSPESDFRERQLQDQQAAKELENVIRPFGPIGSVAKFEILPLRITTPVFSLKRANGDNAPKRQSAVDHRFWTALIFLLKTMAYGSSAD